MNDAEVATSLSGLARRTNREPATVPFMKSPSVVDRIKAYPGVSILILIATIAAGIASFTQSIDAIATFAKKYLVHGKPVEPESRTSTTPSRQAPSVPFGKTFGGTFAGYNWDFIRGRGSVQILGEKITLSTHRAEPLAWVADKKFGDLELSAAFELVSGDTSLGFGPLFWLRDEGTFHHLALRTAGDYRLVRYRDGKERELIPWTHSAKVVVC